MKEEAEDGKTLIQEDKLSDGMESAEAVGGVKEKLATDKSLERVNEELNGQRATPWRDR